MKSPNDSIRSRLGARKLAVFANREPYLHENADGKIRVIRPASGLVTALEPILRACGGLWTAHGSGSADQACSAADGTLAVPPEAPSYRLKRIWLSQQEEDGYYRGFANEGLWPLCHFAHVRPVFRLRDWQTYREVNQRFCDESPLETLGEDPVLLVQDYHFALLPRMLRERSSRTGTRRAPPIALFWHIPWPEPDAFAICPWSREILEGILGADLVAFHTQKQRNNFLATCARQVEAKIDWENSSVTRGGRETLVRAFPIGIEPTPIRALESEKRAELRRRYGIRGRHVAVGVDRLDYTKGLPERVDAVERFLEKNPAFVGNFTYAQIASPSRSELPAYRELAFRLRSAVARVNRRFGTKGVQPIVLLAERHDWEEIQEFYQLGDVCLVTSLHDGMNLVAKEYVWCQAPERGSLVLSRFAGASRELREAFLVNPYATEEVADAIAAALELPEDERRDRMEAMRKNVTTNTAFAWASGLLECLLGEAVPRSEEKPAGSPLDLESARERPPLELARIPMTAAYFGPKSTATLGALAGPKTGD